MQALLTGKTDLCDVLFYESVQKGSQPDPLSEKRMTIRMFLTPSQLSKHFTVPYVHPILKRFFNIRLYFRDELL